MPELPEVEVVRLGLERGVVGRTLAAVQVHHPRAVRRHLAGADDFSARLAGVSVVTASRRGKYLWLGLSSGEAVVGHLGMSGQLLVVPPSSDDQVHLRIRFGFADDGRELRFVDQRTFGGLMVTSTVDGVPDVVAHIARDPLDPLFDEDSFARRLRAKDTALKRALLDQTLVSGIGNIYADETLWRARMHGQRPTRSVSRADALLLLGHARAVLLESLAQGGTSFDALYVSTEGVSGLFARSLHVYGREGEPCDRGCAGGPDGHGVAVIRRDAFMNRSSFTCPVCQKRPRVWHA